MEGFLRSIFCILADLNHGFGGHWDMHDRMFLQLPFALLQCNGVPEMFISYDLWKSQIPNTNTEY